MGQDAASERHHCRNTNVTGNAPRQFLTVLNQDTLRLLKTIGTLSLLTFLTINVWGTTWKPAYPYRQQVKGQKIVIEATPYAPYNGSPMIGITKVYLGKKLLYTIDKYYRERMIPSDDGQYLAIIFNSNFPGIFTSNSGIDFDQTAIEILKNGKTFKRLALRDVIDTTIAFNRKYFSWVYSLDYEALKSAEIGCKSCEEVYGKKVLQSCDSTEIDANECSECKRDCEVMKFKRTAENLTKNSVYAQNNSLFVLTNQSTLFKLDFNTFEFRNIPFETAIVDKKEFNPPKVSRKYNKVKLPDNFAQPKMKDGRRLEKGIADLFTLSIPDINEKEKYLVYIHTLLLDQNGKCVEFYGHVYDQGIDDNFSPESVDKGMTKKLNLWIKEQTFQTKLIPSGFDMYSFLCIANLK